MIIYLIRRCHTFTNHGRWCTVRPPQPTFLHTWRSTWQKNPGTVLKNVVQRRWRVMDRDGSYSILDFENKIWESSWLSVWEVNKLEVERRLISWRLPQICDTSGNTPLEQECLLWSIVKGEHHICHTLDFYWESSLNIPTTIVGDDYFCYTSHANKIFRYWMMLRSYYIHPKKFPMKQSEFLNHS